MKSVWKWLRGWIGRELDAPGRFRLLTMYLCIIVVAFILFGVPQKQLYANINYLQRNHYTTYLIIGALLLFVVIYAGVIRPIHHQIRFMNYYARNRDSRMPVGANNGMGEPARNLNRMLDDIDRLTAENMAAQNRLPEAESVRNPFGLLQAVCLFMCGQWG